MKRALAALPLIVAACAASPRSDFALPHVEQASAAQPARLEPIGGYTLALLWMPEHCRHPVPGAESLICGPATARDFRLHGLWPDGKGESWPQWCVPAAILPRRTIAAHFAVTPSAQLLQHEWAKHGTCIPGMTPGRYFTVAGRLFRAVRYPDMAALADKRLTTGAFAAVFAAANPGMQPDTVMLNLDSEGWLRELWLCFDMKRRPTRCRSMPPADRPVRIRLPDQKAASGEAGRTP